ncbi:MULTISPECIES: DUF1656 domain-containing protein [unclassified Acinetobacter]|uniref:DUF1656 domain-containing protein n=1 Tax=unclassified Acinetobacter TaxID=196816 RepID=UPI00293450C9|nr:MULTISPECIES: DUF1656 domain-containing protein [unclassified Acinetobacter]WOE31294.1 DUF1656 domain-containing protein [Acinetobacter sp. SAAs470]WOE39490.1 DUF1656 domain-containing protein [Acinetobacter sp. SAAs474]
MGELNIYGVYVPVLLIQAIIAYLILRLVMILMDRWATQTWIAFPGIFYLAFYIVILWLIHWVFLLYLP